MSSFGNPNVPKKRQRRAVFVLPNKQLTEAEKRFKERYEPVVRRLLSLIPEDQSDAAFARDCGFTPQSLADWKKGLNLISFEALYWICVKTNTSADWLLWEIGPQRRGEPTPKVEFERELANRVWRSLEEREVDVRFSEMALASNSILDLATTAAAEKLKCYQQAHDALTAGKEIEASNIEYLRVASLEPEANRDSAALSEAIARGDKAEAQRIVNRMNRRSGSR